MHESHACMILHTFTASGPSREDNRSKTRNISLINVAHWGLRRAKHANTESHSKKPPQGTASFPSNSGGLR